MNLKPLFDLLDAQHDSGNQDEYFHEMKHYLTRTPRRGEQIPRGSVIAHFP